MKRRITLLFLTLLIAIFAISCSGISQQEYDNVINELNSRNTQYVQIMQDNTSLEAAIDQLRSQLTTSEQAILSLESEIENYKSLPLKTDVVIRNGTVHQLNVHVPINYFERIEGNIIGDGFRAYLKQSDGGVVLDLGTNHRRQFSFTPPDPFVDYFIDYEAIDETGVPPQYITGYVIFY